MNREKVFTALAAIKGIIAGLVAILVTIVILKDPDTIIAAMTGKGLNDTGLESERISGDIVAAKAPKEPGFIASLINRDKEVAPDPVAVLAEQVGAGSVGALDGTSVDPTAVFDTYQPATLRDFPAELTELAVADSCDIERVPGAHEAVYVMPTAPSGAYMPLHAFDRDDLEFHVQQAIAAGDSEVGFAFEPRMEQAAMRVQDVAITDTKRPVYLVLVANDPNIIFNFSFTTRAKLSRLIILGGDHIGLANRPEFVTTEILTRETLEECGIEISYPSPYAANDPDNLSAKDARWQAWLDDKFDRKVTMPLSGDIGRSALLAGPTPTEATKLARFEPVAGASLMMTDADYIFAGAQWAAAYRDVVMAESARITGSDLAQNSASQ